MAGAGWHGMAWVCEAHDSALPVLPAAPALLCLAQGYCALVATHSGPRRTKPRPPVLRGAMCRLLRRAAPSIGGVCRRVVKNAEPPLVTQEITLFHHSLEAPMSRLHISLLASR